MTEDQDTVLYRQKVQNAIDLICECFSINDIDPDVGLNALTCLTVHNLSYHFNGEEMLNMVKNLYREMHGE